MTQDQSGQSQIRPIAQVSSNSWTPRQGSEVASLIQHLFLDRESADRVTSEAARILGKCISPESSDGSSTGLVLGYVQSGKTLSFTTVAALARDNAYHMVIVITGTATNLLGQSQDRLESDLQLQTNRKWRLFSNPRPDQHAAIGAVLADWQYTLPDHRRSAVLITVMKNWTHLRNLVGLLEQLNLERTPVLVIDDEADQAGLNTRAASGGQSTVYQRLVALRRCLPHHTYLQYTATPQAPLLINLIDSLSPKFAEVLVPGADYVGGEAFFGTTNSLVRTIPPSEISSQANQLLQPPDSLLQALRLFFLGVAAGYALGHDGNLGSRNRSMLVHPSRTTPGHREFYRWISHIRRHWLQMLGDGVDEAERAEFVQSFRPAYSDLSNTVDDLPDFEVLISELPFALRKTEILEVNAQPGVGTPKIDWRNAYPWILVGGQAMDRGFTVEGLTVTYMPRDTGVGNADTIQQRARFFGYKRAYLGYCRVFLEQGLIQAFREYVAHEQDIRRRLQQHGDRPLSEWRRAFFLDSTLRPTRQNVLNLSYKQDGFSDAWFWPRTPQGPVELIEANRHTVSVFCDAHEWRNDAGDARRTPEQIHSVCERVALAEAYRELLIPLRLTSERDSQLFTGLLLQIDSYLQNHPDATCSIYRMSRGQDRLRSVNDQDEIPALFQGRNFAPGSTIDEVYPGDDAIRTPNGLTIQIHMLEVRRAGRGAVISTSVPAVAIWVPAEMERDWLVQQRA